MTRFILAAMGIGAWLACSVCLADEKADAVKAELKRFEGTWKFVSMEFEGQAIPEASFADSRMTIRGDHFTTKGKETAEGTFSVDPTASPKTIDIAIVAGNGKKATILGIYTLEGDTYTICSGLPNGPRATEFSAKAGSRRGLQVMKREAP